MFTKSFLTDVHLSKLNFIVSILY